MAKAEYIGKDGFHSRMVEKNEDIATDRYKLGDVFEKQRRFEGFLEHQKRDVPDFETMADEVSREANSESFQKEIDELKAAHAKDLEHLYDFNANEYKESIRMQYMAQDCTCQDPEAYEIERAAIADLFEAERQGLVSTWANRHEQLRHAYVTALLDLQNNKISAAQDEYRNKLTLERAFPLSIIDFHTKPEDFKYRIAVFLTSDETKKTEIKKQQQWNEEEVKNLCNLYKTDVRDHCSGRSGITFTNRTSLLSKYQKMFASDIQGILVKHKNSILSPKKSTIKRKRPAAAELW
ncbi:hypothetical protein JR316_0005844 [Psilocybe cubensis]|nr:hypothetical protein JR316_0005844 [Psilocybe cubensis]KAH9481322.1 hypothetical protein JR316_0005844 [Psilocybe cubensis]